LIAIAAIASDALVDFQNCFLVICRLAPLIAAGCVLHPHLAAGRTTGVTRRTGITQGEGRGLRI
jgi:hypothetical protein